MCLDTYIAQRIDHFVETLAGLADLNLPYSSLCRQIEGDQADIFNLCASRKLESSEYIEIYGERAAGILFDHNVSIS